MRVGRSALALLIALCGLSALAPAAASASVSHAYTTSFGGAATVPADPYPLSNPSGIAVDNSGGSSAGDIYVTDPANHRVEKFDSSGNFLLMFGKGVDLTTGGNVCPEAPADVCQTGTSSAEAGAFESPAFVAVDNSASASSGDVYVGDTANEFVSKFSSSGQLISGWGAEGQIGSQGTLYGVAVDGAGDMFLFSGSDAHRYSQSGVSKGEFEGPRGTSPNGLAIDAEEHLYKIDGTPEVSKFTTTGEDLGEPDRSGDGSGLAIDPSTNDLYVVQGFSGIVNHYALNCGGTGCTPLDSFGAGKLTAPLGISIDGTTGNAYVADAGAGVVAVFNAVAPYVITGAVQSVTQVSAVVSGHVDPAGRGPITECRFEYGLETSYGASVPCAQGTPFSSPTDVTAEITGLHSGVKYHYRLYAGNAVGSTGGADHTMTTTQPPTIDGFAAKNVTKTSADLTAKINPEGLKTEYRFEYGTTPEYGTSIPIPDEDIGSAQVDESVTQHLTGLNAETTYHFRVVAHNELGTVESEDQTFNFYPPACPNLSLRQETHSSALPDCRGYELVSAEDANGTILFAPSAPNSPSADNIFAYGGALGEIPNVGDPENAISVDTYVATRTSQGWKTRYVGIPGTDTLEGDTRAANLDDSKFLAYNSDSKTPTFSSAPYVYDSQGNLLEQWPSNIGSIPGANDFTGSYFEKTGSLQPSPDFSHMALSSDSVVMAPGGITKAPGSAYDYNVGAGTMTVISKLGDGSDIPPEPTDTTDPQGYIHFPGLYEAPVAHHPAVSTDGSHILMAVNGTPFDQFNNPKPQQHLYMRVDDAAIYDVSAGHDVTYLGMTEDGSHVFFTSNEKLTTDDHDTSTDLYEWSESTDSLTLLSVGNNGNGNQDSCSASWTEKCDVLGVVGWSVWDNPVVDNGDIYFYSPEQLDGNEGTQGSQNLYDYREGRPHFVATFQPDVICNPAPFSGECANGPIGRIDVSPNDEFAAILTSAKLTSAETGGHVEAYKYTPSTSRFVCVSCIPDGTAPAADTTASENGLFMTNDGRVFFYTPEALVPTDTNKLHDVYEYVDGRPRLITSGTGAHDSQVSEDTYSETVRSAGFLGVTEDGVNAYFSTFDSLVGQDQNGNFLRVYDAREGGGFPYNPGDKSCNAADECHGAGSFTPTPAEIKSASDLGNGGNAKPESGGKHHKAKGKHRHHGKRHAHHGKGRQHG